MAGTAECWGSTTVMASGMVPGTAFVDVQAGTHSACGLTASGDSECWFCAPGEFDGCQETWATGLVALRRGHLSYCGVEASGALLCTGEADLGDFGTLPPATSGAFDLDDECVCVLDGQPGTLHCAGRTCPTIQAAPEPTWQFVALGYLNACGLDDQGMATCWGETNSPGEAFPQPPSPGPYAAIEASQQHVCALDLAGYPTCWGTAGIPALATPPPAVPLTELSVGPLHACGLTAQGVAHCWGQDVDGSTVVPP